MSDPWLNQELLIIRDTQIPDQGEGPLSKASIPTEVKKNLYTWQKHLSNEASNCSSRLLTIRALQHSSNEQIHYKTVRLQYSLAVQQIQSSSLSHLTKQAQILQRDLLSTRKHASSLEQVIHNLRDKTQNSDKDTKQISVEHRESLENLATLRAQLQEAQSEIETFSKQYHQEKEAKQEIYAELEAIQGQFKDLKKQVFDSKLSIETSEKGRLAAESLTTALTQKLQDRSSSLEELDQEVKSIKEMLNEGVRQAKAIEKEYLEAIDEKVSATNTNSQLNKTINQSQEEIRLLKEQLNDAHEREQMMQNETGHQLDQLVRQRDQYRNQLKDISETLESLRRHFSELEQSHRLLSEQAKRSEIMHREQEHEIKTAHQHLAKKVKETTILSEQMEDLKLRLIEAQKAHDADKVRINEVRVKIEQHGVEEKRLQEKIHEAQKHGEEQINKWEEKYFRLAEKLQATETRNKELQALEERHNQMQALLAGLGNFVGNNANIASYTQQPQRAHEPAPAPLQKPRKPDTIGEDPESMDLFKDLSQQPRSFKKDLFGE